MEPRTDRGLAAVDRRIIHLRLPPACVYALAGQGWRRSIRIKLSDAIRLGARKRPQGTGIYFPLLADGTIASCALGAAIEGAVPDIDPCMPATDAFRMLGRLFGHVLRLEYTDPTMPEAVTDRFPVESTIYHMNDDAGWSREQIADWLGSLGL